MKISLIICTYNPRMDYLERVLGALRQQTLPQAEWELLVVDNHSPAPLSGRLDLAWHHQARVIREDRPGVAHARVRGIGESTGGILVFVDDDNVLAADYLENCLRIAAEWPQLGVWGASIVPEFEIEPPASIRPYLRILAIREVTQPVWSNVRTCFEAEPWGAGLCIRRSEAQHYRERFHEDESPMVGNTGNLVFGGEDTEMCHTVCQNGGGMGIFPNLKVRHLISKHRLSVDHIVRVTHGYTIRSLLLASKWGGVHPASAFSLVEMSRFLKHLLSRQSIKRRLAWAIYSGRIKATAIIADAEAAKANVRQR